MANLFQAIKNVRKYGLRGAYEGAKNTPGGYLDATPQNRNVQTYNRVKAAGGPGQLDRAAVNYFAPQQMSQESYQTSGSQGFDPSRSATGEPVLFPQPAPVGAGGQSGGFAPQSAPMNSAVAPQAAPTDVFTAPLSAPATPEYLYFGGQQFDIANEADRLNLFKARGEALRGQAGRQIGDYQNQLRSTLDDAYRTNARNLEDIDLDFRSLGETEAEAGRTYDRNIYDTNEAYDLGTVNRANAFAQLSPNAFQSSQGTSQQYANNQRLQALGDIDQARTGTFNDINQSRAGLTRQRTDLGNSYNQYIQDTQNEASQYGNEVNDFYNSQIDDLRGDFTNYDQTAGVNSFRFNRDQFAPVNVQTADLSQYTPYLNFQALQGSPEANYFKSATPAAATGSARDQYLGYSPDQQSKNYIQQYLKRGY